MGQKAALSRRVHVVRTLGSGVLILSSMIAPAVIAQDSETAAPPSAEPPPDSLPPPPPAELPALPQPQTEAIEAPPVEAPEAAPLPDGQWVFTSQYGWVFMPYAQSYTYVPTTGYPFMFLYYPRLGWRWLSAPWIFGSGPHPYWGTRGYTHFAWHARPWFTRPNVGAHTFHSSGPRMRFHSRHR